MENGIFVKQNFLIAVFVVLIWLDFLYAACYRKPQGASGDRSTADGNYQIQIVGNPATYMPGQQYNVSLIAANKFKFTSFTLVVEAESSESLLTSSTADGEELLGHFEIIDKAETKFSTLCENMIESSNTNLKNRVNISWVAPVMAESGCVLFKAAILQHRNVWFIDDGFLTKRLCPEEIDDVNSQTPPVDPCCACDDAKYEIILERKWRRNTHAKDFPSEPWRTKLGDIIGASHSLDYRFWEYGGRASQGLQELAEHGATKTLENEIKEFVQTSRIRTIIKAPGIKYRAKVVGKSLATARVGPEQHVISLVLKIEPSPDWILGVSGLELCLANCTWIEKKVLNLYPWDIGTDAGPSYMSPDQAQHPPDVIRRMSSTFPSDYRSPFFDKRGAPMKPLATLHVIRKRIYEKECNNEESNIFECSTHPWSAYTNCSAICGAGTQYRTRSYKDPTVADNYNCKEVLRQLKNCFGTQCGIQSAESSSAECELTPWSYWSACSKKCGNGFQTRTRDYRNPYAKEKCQAGVKVELKQTKTCNGENCGGNIANIPYSPETPEYDTNSNERYDQNYDQEETIFKNSKNLRGSQKTNWRTTEKTEEDEENYDAPNNNYDYTDIRSKQPNNPFLSPDNNGEILDAKNIYGNEKFVGIRPGSSYEQNKFGNKNYFHNLEPKYGDNKFLTNNKNNDLFKKEKATFEQTPGFENFSPTNTQGTYGYKTIESEEREQQTQNFCLGKPIAYFGRCKQTRLIVKNYWFYDYDDGECKLFTADNCDENKNKFFSLEKCLEACGQSQNIMSYNRGHYNSEGYEVTPRPPVGSRWN